MGFLAVLRSTNDLNGPVQILKNSQESFQEMCPCFGFTEPVPGSPDDHLFPMFQILDQKLFKRQGPRFPVDQHQKNKTEGGAQRGMQEKEIPDPFRILPPLQFNHQPDPLPVRFIP